MVSRRKILSRSRDDLNLDGGEGGGRNGAPGGGGDQDEEDVWYHKEKLFKVRVHSVSLRGGRMMV